MEILKGVRTLNLKPLKSRTLKALNPMEIVTQVTTIIRHFFGDIESMRKELMQARREQYHAEILGLGFRVLYGTWGTRSSWLSSFRFFGPSESACPHGNDHKQHVYPELASSYDNVSLECPKP